MADERDPTILWTYTWPQDDTRHEPDDLTAWDGETRIGRIYPVKTEAYGIVWKWFSWAEGVVPPAGQTGSRREAMLAVEDRYSGKTA